MQYAKLREAAAGRDLPARQARARARTSARASSAACAQQLDLAVDRDDDPAALALISRREALGDDVERLTADLTELTAEADAAKRNLVPFQDEIVRLREERVRMLARLANAKARLRLHETLSGLSPEADIQALETVREHVNRLVAEVALVRDGRRSRARAPAGRHPRRRRPRRRRARSSKSSSARGGPRSSRSRRCRFHSLRRRADVA